MQGETQPGETRTPLKENQEPVRASTRFSNREYDPLSSQMRNLNIAATTVANDESQINDILKGLRNKLIELENYTEQKENEKAGVIEDINVLTQRLKYLNNSIVQKRNLFAQQEKVIKDSETALTQITESARTLLSYVKQESATFAKYTYAPVSKKF